MQIAKISPQDAHNFCDHSFYASINSPFTKPSVTTLAVIFIYALKLREAK